MKTLERNQIKEKRYISDYIFDNIIMNRRFGVCLIIFLFILAIIGIIVGYNYMLVKYEKELNSYSESAYIYLDDIADNVIKEGVGIDLLALPDDVTRYEITGENGKIKFKYYLDTEKEMVHADLANMTIELSDDFTIISKKPNYFSEEEYIRDMKCGMIIYVVTYAYIVLLIILSTFCLFCLIIISTKNKEKNLRMNITSSM